MYWQLVNTGPYYRGQWINTSGTIYTLGDVTVHKSTTYVCKKRNMADDSSLVEPDLDVTNSYWDKQIQGALTNVLEY